MNRDKQIEKMAKDLCHTDTCEIKKIGIPCNHRCKAHIYATRAIDKGYRKASEVAREIFEEILQTMNEVYSSVQYGCYSYGTTKDIDSPSAQRQCGKLEGVKYLGDRIAELKKKYIDEDTK